MVHILAAEEGVHVRSELQQLLKPITEGNEYTEFVTLLSRAGGGDLVVVTETGLRTVTLDVTVVGEDVEDGEDTAEEAARYH